MYRTVGGSGHGSILAFPLGGRCHSERMTEEGSGTNSKTSAPHQSASPPASPEGEAEDNVERVYSPIRTAQDFSTRSVAAAPSLGRNDKRSSSAILHSTFYILHLEERPVRLRGKNRAPENRSAARFLGRGGAALQVVHFAIRQNADSTGERRRAQGDMVELFPYEQIVKIIYGHGMIAVRVKISPSAETFSCPPYFLAISCMLFRPKPCSAASFLQVAGKPSVMRRAPEK